MKFFRTIALTASAALVLFGAACTKKKVAVNTPPPTPAPAAVATSAPAAAPVRQVARTTPPAQASPRYPDAATRRRIDELLGRISDAYFDYNRHDLRPDAVKALEADAIELRDILKDYPDYKLTVEGHCDERGSDEYNIGLGDARAKAAKDYLVGVGIPDGQLSIISYGKERPVCSEHDEACWQKNRRIHIVAMSQPQK